MSISEQHLPDLVDESAEERLLRETVRAIAGDLGPGWFRRAAAEGNGDALWDALGTRGFLGVHLPAAHGGGGCGLSELAAVVEETAAAGCPVLAALYSPGVIGTILAQHGTPEQQARWLPGIAAGTLRASFAMTEPDAGSNAHNVTTRARRAGDGFVLHGQKHFISGMEDADVVMVVARTGTDAASGRGRLSVFLVDADAPGLSRRPLPTALEMPERQWIVHFDDVEVAADRLVGPLDGGLKVAFAGMNTERILTGSICTGIGLYALARAVAYAREREVWGRPIGTHQAISHPLAEAKIALESARLLTRRACALYDLGEDAGAASNMAKLAGADAGCKSLDHAIQTHGGNGVALEYELANYWFIVRTLQMGPVSREMVLNYVAERLLGLPRSY